MSSPSSSGSGKRKLESIDTSRIPTDLLQPSSRDASGEDAGDSTSQAVINKPNKRPRTRSNAALPPPGKAKLQDPVGYHTNPPPTDRPVRVYADGVFDLFHLGHMRQLEQAKHAFPDVHLMVGVTGDVETHKRKGLTVLSGSERAETVRHCKWVDEVVPNCPWIVTPEFLEQHEIDYVAHDDLPYGADEGDDIYAPVKKAGKFLVTQRTEGVSTTGIITKIVRDYEKYISRQLKRGTSRQELNISWLKKNELDLKRQMTELKDTVRHNWLTTGQELSREFRQFWQSSRSASPARGIEQSKTIPTSPASIGHLGHLDVPRTESPARGPSSDFAAGYSLGLIGGVRSWMTKSRTTLQDSSRNSPESSDENMEVNSPTDGGMPSRGRKDKQSSPMDHVDGDN